jgi:hypothetical protein
MRRRGAAWQHRPAQGQLGGDRRDTFALGETRELLQIAADGGQLEAPCVRLVVASTL